MCIRDSAQIGQRALADHIDVKAQALAVDVSIDDQRLARLDDPARQSLAVRDGVELIAILIGKVDPALARLEQRDVGDVGVEQPADALSLIHISEPTRLLSISYAVFCLKKKK